MNSAAFSKHDTPFPAMSLHLEDASEISHLRAGARLPPGFVPLWKIEDNDNLGILIYHSLAHYTIGIAMVETHQYLASNSKSLFYSLIL